MDHIFYFPETMLWPLAACLVLTGIHVYLGVHVIARKVIFVDLALAQIAALGTVTGVLLGYEVGVDVNQLYLYSLAFTFFGAFVFSMTRMRGEKVPHEAIIGIVYAVAFAATILVLARSPLGPQELDRIIKGELLWVRPNLVVKTAILYSIVGLFHYVFRKKFIAISFDPEKEHQNGINVRLWDFLFYMSFGFVITSSVAIAGVFLVFSYLVIPAVGAMLLAEKISTRLTIGWIGGALISFIGVKLSWHTGLPTSPLIVCLLALTLILAALVRYFKVVADRRRAVRNVVASSLVFAIFLGTIFFFRKHEETPYDHTLHMLESKLATDRTIALENISNFPDHKDEWLPIVVQRLTDEDAQVRRAAVQRIAELKEKSLASKVLPLIHDPSSSVRLDAIHALSSLGDQSTASTLLQSAASEDDEEVKVALLGSALALGESRAIPPLIAIAVSKSLFSSDAQTQLRDHLALPPSVKTLPELKKWWEANQHRLEFDAAAKQYRSGQAGRSRAPESQGS
jgi:zinc/manganese transport system permease protein